MSPEARGMTALDDRRSAGAGVTLAVGGIGAPQTQSVAVIGTEKTRNRREIDVIESKATHRSRDGATSGVNPMAGIVRMPLFDEGAAFKVIEAARAVCSDDEVSTATEAQYNKTIERFERLIGEQPERRASECFIEVLSSTYNKDTFKTYKMAVCWHLRQQIELALAGVDPDQDVEVGSTQWLGRVAFMEQLISEYQEVYTFAWTAAPEVDAGTALPTAKARASGKKKPVAKSLAKKEEGWRSAMVSHAQDGPYADPVRVLDMIGCRPEELAHGVTVKLNALGQLVIRVDHGAKVTDEAGQPWREITFPDADIPSEWGQRLAGQQSFQVKIDSKDGLRAYLRRLSKRLFPKMPRVTAYVFRHAVATEMRIEGLATEELAAFLGHSVAKTQKTYGERRGGRRVKRSRRRPTVEVPRQIKPLDRSGLKRVVGRSKKSKSAPA